MSAPSSARWEIIRILAQSYALEIMEALNKKPMRFSDLSVCGPNERTRSQRLKELEKAGLISTTSIKIKKRHFVHYQLSEKGKVVFQKLEDLLKAL